MNWEAVAAIGQGVSALALVFVFLQLRHARETMQQGARQNRLEATREVFLALATHPQLASAMERLGTSSAPMPFDRYTAASGLTEAEGRQVYAFASAVWQNYQGAIESIGLLSAGVREDVNNALRRLYSGNGVQAKWYELMKSQLNPDAVHYIDALIVGS